MFLKNFEKIIKLLSTFFGSVVGFFIGDFDGFIISLLIFVICDIVTGIICSAANKKLSSKTGFVGLGKKILIFVMVGICNILDKYILRDGSILRTAAVFFYISNEGLSIIENACKIGLPVPEKLKNVLKNINEKE